MSQDSFQKTIVVVAEDLDDLNHVNNIRYLEWIQDISKEHWTARTPDQLRKEVVWVVLNHYIEYKNAAFLGDKVEIKTYIAKTKGAISTRVVEMRLENSEAILVKSTTEWCLLNASTFKPMRISDEIRSYFEG